MIDTTEFPDVEAALVGVVKPLHTGMFVSNTTPSPIPAEAIIVGSSGGGVRDWGEAAANVGINIYAATDKRCRELVAEVQSDLAAASNDDIEHIQVPVGGTSIPRQSPPFQRYFVVTVWLRGQADLS